LTGIYSARRGTYRVLYSLRVRQIQRDRSPELRAIETLFLVVPLFVALFAWSYRDPPHAAAVRAILVAGRSAAAGLRTGTLGAAGDESAPAPAGGPRSVPDRGLDEDDDDSEREHDRARDETGEPGSAP